MEAGGYTIVGHNGYIVEDGKESIIDGARRYCEGPSPYVSLYCKGYLDTCTVLAKRDALLAVGGFDESLPNAQDFELWLRVLKEPQTKFLVFDEVLSRYHVMPGSIMSHTERRLSCSLEIAMRFAPYIAAHSGHPIKSLWLRILAVYYEAAQTYFRQKAFPLLLLICMRLPIRILFGTLKYYLAKQIHQYPFEMIVTQWPLSQQRAAISIALYVWIGGASLSYLYQFRDLAGDILATVGLK